MSAQCGRCMGTGKEYVLCRHCNGIGCLRCGSTGYERQTVCTLCWGTGRI